jgi:hypothetical protein
MLKENNRSTPAEIVADAIIQDYCGNLQMDRNEYERLLKLYDNDGKIRKMFETAIKGSIRKEGIFMLIIAAIGISLIIGLMYLFINILKFNSILIPLGGIGSILTILILSIKKIVYGKPDEKDIKVLLQISSGSK